MTLMNGMQPLHSGTFNISAQIISSASAGGLVGMPFVMPANVFTMINFTRLESTQGKQILMAGNLVNFPSTGPGVWTQPRAFYQVAGQAFAALFQWVAGAPSTTVWLDGTYAIYYQTGGIN